MLSSPLQWPFLVAGCAGLATFTWAAAMMGHRRDTRRFIRCGQIAMNATIASLMGLIIIDFAAIYLIGRTQMIGLRFTLGMFGWMLLVLLPLTLFGRRARRRHGWLDPGQTTGGTKPDDEG